MNKLFRSCVRNVDLEPELYSADVACVASFQRAEPVTAAGPEPLTCAAAAWQRHAWGGAAVAFRINYERGPNTQRAVFRPRPVVYWQHLGP